MIERSNTIILVDQKIVNSALEYALKGGVSANIAEIKLIELHMANMKKGSDDFKRAQKTIGLIQAGKRRYNFEIPPITQAH